MSNYIQTVFFAPKDALLTGNPLKLIKGTEVDPELAAIAVAIATKFDSTNFTGGTPSALVGLTAIAGSASTWMRSDGAPALNQAITPTWTGGHVFGSATGGNQGAGTINATGLFINGVAVTGGAVPAVPSALVGLTAVNGASAGYIRADSAPALNQAISPTWTGAHTFTGHTVSITGDGTNTPVTIFGGGAGFPIQADSTFAGGPAIRFTNSGTTVGFVGPGGNNLITGAANNDMCVRSDGHNLRLVTTTGTANGLLINAAGNVSVLAPSSGTAFTATQGATGVVSISANNTSSGSGSSIVFSASNVTDADCNITLSQVSAATKFARLSPTVAIELQLGGSNSQAKTYEGAFGAAGYLKNTTSDSGTFSTTFTIGTATSASFTVGWVRAGNMVSLYVNAAALVTTTASSGVLIFAGVPAGIRPAQTRGMASIAAVSNGVTPGFFQVDSAGNTSLGIGVIGAGVTTGSPLAGNSNFPQSTANCGLLATWTVTYPII